MLNLLIACFLSVIVTPNLLAMVTKASPKVGPFKLKSSEMKKFDNGEYQVKRYENLNGYFIEQRQSFPVVLITDFFRESIVVNQQVLSVFIKTFLGDIGIQEDELQLYYNVMTAEKTSLKNIVCYGNTKIFMGMPSCDQYKVFSPETRLLAKYNTYYNMDTQLDHLNKVILHHLDNNAKKRTVKISQQFKINSVFVEDYYLIIGSYIVTSDHKYATNKYRIDVYNAEQFSKNNDVSESNGNSNDLAYAVGMNICIPSKDLTHDEAQSNKPIYKIETIFNDANNIYCVMLNQVTKKRTSIQLDLDRKAFKISGVTDGLYFIFDYDKPKLTNEVITYFNSVDGKKDKKVLMIIVILQKMKK
ncbi:hypothetical protein EKK58_02875 [Candidatus Dependentiae bacterium]|nr:MAG: hypothetical protein EKK58_02875 [Candidatus Dependentiae bacterium]